MEQKQEKVWMLKDKYVKELVDGYKKDGATIVEFHAFTDGRDEYLADYDDALLCIARWRNEGLQNLRIWTFVSDDYGGNDEDCVFSEGDFPL